MSLILSVVIPVYKTEQYLGDCLKSLSGLTDFREKTEVIVVSDCSPGPAEEICQKFSSRLNLRYHQHKRNLSVFQARKSGIDLARGRYILSLDSDDYLIEMRWGI